MSDDLLEEAIVGVVGARLRDRARGRIETLCRWWDRLVMAVVGIAATVVLVLLILDSLR